MSHATVISLVINIAALVAAGLLSLPTLREIVKRCWHTGGYAGYANSFYADRDGEATEESLKAFTNNGVQHSCLIAVTICGVAVALLRAVISASTVEAEPWLQFLIWAFVLLQYSTLGTGSSWNARFTRGWKGALCCCIAIGGEVVEISKNNSLGHMDEMQILLIGVNCGLAFLVIVLSLCISRRPDVFHNNRVVDGEHSTSLLSLISFSWAGSLIDLSARTRDILLEHLPQLDYQTRSKTLRDAFIALEKKGTSDSNPTRSPLWKILISLNNKELAVQLCLAAPLALLSFAPHLALREILRLLEEPSQQVSDTVKLWSWVFGLGLAVAISSCLENWLLWIGFNKISIRVLEQLSVVVFGKAMYLNGSSQIKDDSEISPDEKQKTPPLDTQNTMNLVAVDAQRIATSATYLYYNFLIPMKLAVACWLLQELLGWGCLVAGILCLLLLTPFNYICIARYTKAEGDLMEARDLKMAVLTEALQGMRQIKFAAHESMWETKINQLRHRELQAQGSAFNWKVANESLYLLGPVLVSIVSLALYSWINGNLIPSVAFTAISVVGYIQFTLSLVPELLSELLDGLISVKRVGRFLDINVRPCSTSPSDRIQFENASLGWPGSTSCALQNVTASFPPRGLTVVSGRTGSGKSLLLAAILGECEVLAGIAKVPEAPSHEQIYETRISQAQWTLDSAIAYVAQIPWIEAATIRDNVLFGLPLDVDRYHKVLFACALTQDLKDFEDSDLTEIGPKGVNLSGGQKSRISLARALYSRAGILVLDDIFGAVDVHTAQHLYTYALTGELAEGRTKVLATHHVGLCLAKADYLVCLEHGMLRFAGTRSEMQRCGIFDLLGHDGDIQRLHQDNHLEHPHPSEVVDSANKGTRKYVEEEAREKGAVKAQLIQQYVQSSGGWFSWTPLLGSFLAYTTLLLGQNWWVTKWSQPGSPGSSNEHPDMMYYLSVYIGLSLVAWAVGSLRSYMTLRASIQASQKLFHRLLYVVLRAPLRWLDTMPPGRLLNRFSADFNIIDSRLGCDLMDLLSAAMECFGVMLAGMIVSPILIIPAAILICWSIWYARRYLAAAREVKRLEGISRSPIYELFDSSITGLWTIRAFGKIKSYVQLMQDRIDDHARAYWNLYLLNRWITFRVNIIGAAFCVSTAVVVVGQQSVTGSMAGFAISFTNQLAFALVLGIRMYANLEMGMNGVERVLEYCDVETENYNGLDPSVVWPTQGRLDVRNLTVSYSPDLPPVLQDLSFHANPNERIGVLGRTGAGKSSLALALFRFLEARGGQILVDGVDISKVKLDHLRSRLAIIPQNPVLFTGTVRSNLDPLGRYEDQELLLALRHVRWMSNENQPAKPEQIGEPFTASREAVSPLDVPICEGGLNVSQGQRQLLCLARAMVCKPKILVLDEATSSVDKATDELIQQSIRSDFGRQGTTLIVIAHRINTIADFDKTLVLDAGRAVEFGTPMDLLRNETGVFRRMVEGDAESEHLKAVINEHGRRKL